jgi:hypothetical protein
MKSFLPAAERGLEDSYGWFVGRRAIIETIPSRFAFGTRVAVDKDSTSL